MKTTAIAEHGEPRKRKVSDSQEASFGCLTFVWSLGNLFLAAWVLSVFWTWFVSSVFPQLPESITIWQSLGFMLVVGLVRGLSYNYHDHSSREKCAFAFINTLRLLVLLGMGWLVHYVIANGGISVHLG